MTIVTIVLSVVLPMTLHAQRVWRPGRAAEISRQQTPIVPPAPKTGHDWNDLLAENGQLWYDQLVRHGLREDSFTAAAAESGRVYVPLGTAYICLYTSRMTYDELPAFEYHLRSPRTFFVRWKLLGEGDVRSDAFSTVRAAASAVSSHSRRVVSRFNATWESTGWRVTEFYPTDLMCYIVLDTTKRSVVDFVDCHENSQLVDRMPDDVDEEPYRVAYESRIHNTLYGTDITVDELETAVQKAAAAGDDAPKPLRPYPLELTTVPHKRKHFFDPNKVKK